MRKRSDTVISILAGLITVLVYLTIIIVEPNSKIDTFDIYFSFIAFATISFGWYVSLNIEKKKKKEQYGEDQNK